MLLLFAPVRQVSTNRAGVLSSGFDVGRIAMLAENVLGWRRTTIAGALHGPNEFNDKQTPRQRI